MITTSATVTATAPAPDPVPIVPMYDWQLGYSPQTIDISFHDFLHALNPLQHLPVVGMLYRAITHDEIPVPLQIGGAFVFGALTGNIAGGFGSVLVNFAEGLLQLGPAVPGHVLQAAQWTSGAEAGPSERLSDAPGVTYADGTTGTPLWREGELTNFDMTVPQAPDGDAHAQHVAAIRAYNRCVRAIEGLPAEAA